MTAMDVAVGAGALVCVFVGVLMARLSRSRARGDTAHPGRSGSMFAGLFVMAVGLFFAMNVSLWLILPALVVAEAARRLVDRSAQ